MSKPNADLKGRQVRHPIRVHLSQIGPTASRDCHRLREASLSPHPLTENLVPTTGAARSTTQAGPTPGGRKSSSDRRVPGYHALHKAIRGIDTTNIHP